MHIRCIRKTKLNTSAIIFSACKIGSTVITKKVCLQAQAEVDHKATQEKQVKEIAKKAKHDTAAERIDNVELILDLSKLYAVPCKLTVIQINLPLDWHHRNGNAEVILMRAFNFTVITIIN